MCCLNITLYPSVLSLASFSHSVIIMPNIYIFIAITLIDFTNVTSLVTSGTVWLCFLKPTAQPIPGRGADSDLDCVSLHVHE